MRRIVWLAVAAMALAGAGAAVAHSISGKNVKSVSASFTATTVSNSATTTCTNADGTVVLTKADYSGTATSSEPSLNGPIVLRVLSLINTTKNLGVLAGRLRIDTASADDTAASFQAVYSGGQANGLASGPAPASPGRLLGNLSASFSAAGGFTNGKIGGTAAGGAAVVLGPGGCVPGQAQGQVRQRAEAKGTVTAVSQTSITVAGVTCAVPAALAEKVSKLKVGDRAEIRCEQFNNQLTLVKVEKQDENQNEKKDEKKKK